MMNELERELLVKKVQDGLKEFIIGEIYIQKSIDYINLYPKYIIKIRNNNFIFTYEIHQYYLFKEQDIDKTIEDIIIRYKKDIDKLFFFDRG